MAGKLVIQPLFEKIGRDRSEECKNMLKNSAIAIVITDKEIGYMNKTGEYIWTPTK